MPTTVDHPEICYVSDPVHLSGELTGEPPRMRHYQDCGHFEWGDGRRLDAMHLASPEQMLSLPACQHCAGRGDGPAGEPGNGPSGPESGRTGAICPGCYEAMSLTGICGNCG